MKNLTNTCHKFDKSTYNFKISTTRLLFCPDINNMVVVLFQWQQHWLSKLWTAGKARKINSIIILQLFLCFLVFFLSSCFISFWDQTFDCQNQDFFWRQNLSILILGFFFRYQICRCQYWDLIVPIPKIGTISKQSQPGCRQWVLLNFITGQYCGRLLKFSTRSFKVLGIR